MKKIVFVAEAKIFLQLSAAGGDTILVEVNGEIELLDANVSMINRCVKTSKNVLPVFNKMVFFQYCGTGWNRVVVEKRTIGIIVECCTIFVKFFNSECVLGLAAR